MGRYAEKLASKAALKALGAGVAGAGVAGAGVYAGKKIHEAGRREGFGRGMRAQQIATRIRRGVRAEEVLRRAAARRMQGR